MEIETGPGGMPVIRNPALRIFGESLNEVMS
jgi:hypothetical protein